MADNFRKKCEQEFADCLKEKFIDEPKNKKRKIDETKEVDDALNDAFNNLQIEDEETGERDPKKQKRDGKSKRKSKRKKSKRKKSKRKKSKRKKSNRKSKRKSRS